MLRLLRDQIAVVPIEDPDRVGSLWIPDRAKQRIDQGVVKYRGPDCKEVKVGDYVLFGGYVGTHISVVEEGLLYFMREQDVHCIIEGDSQPLLPPREFLRLTVKALGEVQQSNGLSDDLIKRIGEKIESHLNDYVFSKGLQF